MRHACKTSCSRLSDALSHGRSQVDDDHVDDVFLPPEAAVMRHLSPSVANDALERVVGVASACGKMFSPLCKYVQSSLSRDVEQLVLAIHESDPDFTALSEDESEDIYVIPFPSSDESSAAHGPSSTESGLSNNPARSARGVPERHDPAPQMMTVPHIVVTSAPPQESREMTSCVPVQDTSFGARLTVPAHTALNAFHPPMVPTPYPPTPLFSAVRNWTYRQGHWCAVVPGLDEQERRGIFSRPINLRRRAMRKRPRDHPKYYLQGQNETHNFPDLLHCCALI